VIDPASSPFLTMNKIAKQIGKEPSYVPIYALMDLLANKTVCGLHDEPNCTECIKPSKRFTGEYDNYGADSHFEEEIKHNELDHPIISFER
jgi:hypothetical protein